jgi:hypothetical protein
MPVGNEPLPGSESTGSRADAFDPVARPPSIDTAPSEPLLVDASIIPEPSLPALSSARRSFWRRSA